MKKGDIYMIKRRDTIGSEIAKARPGVIVSRDELNSTSSVVMVVFLTTKPKKTMPSHVLVQSTGRESLALCEQINSVSKTLLSQRLGQCTAEEMELIEDALASTLDIRGPAPFTITTAPTPALENDPVNHPAHYNSGNIEVIDFIEDQKLGYHLGSAVKYICRAGKKDPTKIVEDLEKAVWFIKRKIKRLEE